MGLDVSAGMAERLRALAERCRDLADITAVPEIVEELASIAAALEAEAERLERE
jgi:hypothetical protein